MWCASAFAALHLEHGFGINLPALISARTLARASCLRRCIGSAAYLAVRRANVSGLGFTRCRSITGLRQSRHLYQRRLNNEGVGSNSVPHLVHFMAYAKESARRKVLMLRMSVAATFQRTDERLKQLVCFLLRCLQKFQLGIGLFLRGFQLNQHPHSGQNQLSNRGYFAIMLIDALFLGHDLSLPDSVRFPLIVPWHLRIPTKTS